MKIGNHYEHKSHLTQFVLFVFLNYLFDMEKLIKRNMSDFLNKEYLKYCFSVLEERAIPSVIDGFKPGGRKIMHAALAGTTKNGNLVKLLAL